MQWETANNITWLCQKKKRKENDDAKDKAEKQQSCMKCASVNKKTGVIRICAIPKRLSIVTAKILLRLMP